MWLFRSHLVLNAAWTPTFFGLRRPAIAFGEIVATLVAILATTVGLARLCPHDVGARP